MQPRRCGAVNLKSWRTDRKPPGARLSSLRFRPGACVPQRPGASLWLAHRGFQHAGSARGQGTPRRVGGIGSRDFRSWYPLDAGFQGQRRHQPGFMNALARHRLARFLGTFLPLRRASERPMAIACLRLFTFVPLLPLLSVPRLRLRIAPLTSFDALREYLRAIVRSPYCMTPRDPRHGDGKIAGRSREKSHLLQYRSDLLPRPANAKARNAKGMPSGGFASLRQGSKVSFSVGMRLAAAPARNGKKRR